MILPSAYAALLLAASPQGHVVVVDDQTGPGVDFTDLQFAIDAANDGDVLLVKEGLFGLCWLDGRDLTVCAEAGAVVDVERVIVSDLAAGQAVRLQGLRSELRTSLTPCQLQDNTGRVWIEDCAFEPAAEPAFPGFTAGSSGITVSNCPSIVLVNVQTRGQTFPSGLMSSGTMVPGRGMHVQSSAVDAFGCAFRGGDGTTFTFSPAGSTLTQSALDALYIEGPCRVHLSSCEVSGGTGGPSVKSTTGSCLFGTGGTGIRARCQAGCPELGLHATTIAAGAGGPASSDCPKGPDGTALQIEAGTQLFESPSPALSLEVSSPVRENTLLDLALHGPPQTLAFLGVSASSDALFAPALAAPLVLAPPILGIALGALSESGELLVSLPLLELPPGLESMVFHGQSAYLDPLNAVVLGQAGMVVLLDETL